MEGCWIHKITANDGLSWMKGAVLRRGERGNEEKEGVGDGKLAGRSDGVTGWVRELR